MSAEKSQYVLEMRGITKAFPGVLALDKVNLKVREGAVPVLVGQRRAAACEAESTAETACILV